MVKQTLFEPGDLIVMTAPYTLRNMHTVQKNTVGIVLNSAPYVGMVVLFGDGSVSQFIRSDLSYTNFTLALWRAFDDE